MWISSQHTIHSIKMTNLELREIKLFDDNFVREMEPYILQAVCTSVFDLVAVCYVKDDLAIAYQKQGRLETDIHYLNDIIPDSKYFFSIPLTPIKLNLLQMLNSTWRKMSALLLEAQNSLRIYRSSKETRLSLLSTSDPR